MILGNGEVVTSSAVKADIEQLDIVMRIPKAVGEGAVAVANCPKLSRPLVAPSLKEIKHLDFLRDRMKSLIAPILEYRLSDPAAGPDSELPPDVISWSIKETQGKAWDPSTQVKYQIEVGKPISILRKLKLEILIENFD